MQIFEQLIEEKASESIENHTFIQELRKKITTIEGKQKSLEDTVKHHIESTGRSIREVQIGQEINRKEIRKCMQEVSHLHDDLHKNELIFSNIHIDYSKGAQSYTKQISNVLKQWISNTIQERDINTVTVIDSQENGYSKIQVSFFEHELKCHIPKNRHILYDNFSIYTHENLHKDTTNRITKLRQVYLCARNKGYEVSLEDECLYINGYYYTFQDLDRLPKGCIFRSL